MALALPLRLTSALSILVLALAACSALRGADDGPVPEQPVPPPPVPTTLESVTLEDGGMAVQAHLPDAGSGWVQTADGKAVLVVGLEDGGQERVPFTMPGSGP